MWRLGRADEAIWEDRRGSALQIATPSFVGLAMTFAPNFGNGTLEDKEGMADFIQEVKHAALCIFVVALLATIVSSPVHPSDAHSSLPHNASNVSLVQQADSPSQSSKAKDEPHPRLLTQQFSYYANQVVSPPEHPPQ